MNAPPLAWGLWGLAMVLVIPGPVLQTALEWKDETDLPFLLGFVIMQVGTATAGAVIASRLPRNAVGWCFLAMGVGMAVAISCGSMRNSASTHGAGPSLLTRPPPG